MFPSRKSPCTTVDGSGSGTSSASLRADLLDLRELARLVDLPELREAPDLPLVVAPGASECDQGRRLDVGGVDLDERVDEIEAERASRSLRLEAGGRVVRRHEPVQIRHDVERDAEQALVLAHRGDRRQPREPGVAQRELEPRLAHDVVRGRRQRRTRGPAEDEAL